MVIVVFIPQYTNNYVMEMKNLDFNFIFTKRSEMIMIMMIMIINDYDYGICKLPFILLSGDHVAHAPLTHSVRSGK